MGFLRDLASSDGHALFSFYPGVLLLLLLLLLLLFVAALVIERGRGHDEAGSVVGPGNAPTTTGTVDGPDTAPPPPVTEAETGIDWAVTAAAFTSPGAELAVGGDPAVDAGDRWIFRP